MNDFIISLPLHYHKIYEREHTWELNKNIDLTESIEQFPDKLEATAFLDSSKDDSTGSQVIQMQNWSFPPRYRRRIWYKIAIKEENSYNYNDVKERNKIGKM